MTRTQMTRTDEGIEIASTYRDGGEGETLLFCPGLGGTQLGFAADAEYFAGRGYRCLTVDLRGLGRSSRPDRVSQDMFTPEKLAGDAIEVIDSLGLPPVHFVGNSLGGVVGLEIIRQRPERLASLITFGTTYHLDLPHWQVPVQYFIHRLIGPKRLPNFIANKGTKFDHARPVIREMYSDFPPHIGRQMSANIAKYDYRETAVGWNRPILLIQGDQDKAINANLKTTLAALSEKPDFHHVQLENAGHFMNLDNPDGVRRAILDFLQGPVAADGMQ